MDGTARDQWQAALPSEVDFWRDLIAGTFPNQEWVQSLRTRLTGSWPFPEHLHQYVASRTAPRILDVGAGPATVIGPVGAPVGTEIVAVDPLAGVYSDLLSKNGLTASIPTRPGEGERLTELGLGTFDLVYSRNALDHAYDALKVIREMVAVCKPDGVVYFEGSVNESVKQNAEGLHQWNFMPLDNGDLVVWQQNKVAMSLRKALGEKAKVKASGSDWYSVEITS